MKTFLSSSLVTIPKGNLLVVSNQSIKMSQFQFPVTPFTVSFDEIGLKISPSYPSIMIPFVHPNKLGIVKEVFEGLRIGKVAKVDSILRQDGKGKHYQVFVHFEFWDERNPDAMRLRTKISNGETAKIEYERPWFWTLALNTKVRAEHVAQFNPPPPPSLSFSGHREFQPQVMYPVAPPLRPFHSMPPMAPMLAPMPPMAPMLAPTLPPFPQMEQYREQPQMIPRVLRMARIGHFEKRRPRQREMPPQQLVAYKNPPVEEPEELNEAFEKLAIKEEDDEDNKSVVSDITEASVDPLDLPKSKKGYYNDTDAPKSEVVVPEYDTQVLAECADNLKKRKAKKSTTKKTKTIKASESP